MSQVSRLCASTLRACMLQGHVWIDTQGQKLLSTLEMTLEPPVARAVRIDPQVQPVTVAELVRLVARLRGAQRDRGEFVARRFGGTSPFTEARYPHLYPHARPAVNRRRWT